MVLRTLVLKLLVTIMVTTCISLYSSTIAWHTFGINIETVLRATLKSYYRVGYLSPDAK